MGSVCDTCFGSRQHGSYEEQLRLLTNENENENDTLVRRNNTDVEDMIKDNIRVLLRLGYLTDNDMAIFQALKFLNALDEGKIDAFFVLCKQKKINPKVYY